MAKTIETPDELMVRTEHPLKAEIEALRKIVRDATPALAERVKWNAPSYYLAANPKLDMGSFNLHQRGFVQLVIVFHGGTMIEGPILGGDYKDRRLLRFDDMADVNAKAAELARIVREWARITEGLA